MAREVEHDGPSRRWIRGSGGAVPPGSDRLLRHGAGGLRRWASAGRAAGPGVDQVEAERIVWDLVDAGLVAVRERRDRRGDWQPYQWTCTARGEALVAAADDPVDVAAYLEQPDPDHPVLVSIRAWLTAERRPLSLTARLVLAIGRTLRAGRLPRGRLVAIEVGGHTKAVRLEDHRDALEEALGCPLDDVVRLHGRSVLAYGPFRFRVGGETVRGTWSVPWLALTPETLEAMEDLEVDAARLLTVENLVAFEEEVRRGIPTGTVAVYTGGFPHGLERAFLQRLCGCGVREVHHWGDLDLGGLRILRHLADVLPVPVRPFRMEPDLLDRLPTRPLTERDREGLRAWVEDPEAPGGELARAMLAKGVKAEQEGWFLGRG